MARFSGVKQGIAVWIWTIVVTALATILIAVTDAQFDVPDGLPQLPTETGHSRLTVPVMTLVRTTTADGPSANADGAEHRGLDRLDPEGGRTQVFQRHLDVRSAAGSSCGGR
jgi:hypothetical protein